jgi:hypothetical protein
MADGNSTKHAHHTRYAQDLQVLCNFKSETEKLNYESEGTKSDKFNGRVYHDIATVKEIDEDKKLGQKTVCHITAKETNNFKQSTFFVYKSDMPKDMCAFMQQEKVHGHLIKIIRLDNAGGKNLVTLAHLQDKMLGTIFENTACKTQQQNFYAELAFMVIAAKTMSYQVMGT